MRKPSKKREEGTHESLQREKTKGFSKEEVKTYALNLTPRRERGKKIRRYGPSDKEECLYLYSTGSSKSR